MELNIAYKIKKSEKKEIKLNWKSMGMRILLILKNVKKPIPRDME